MRVPCGGALLLRGPPRLPAPPPAGAGWHSCFTGTRVGLAGAPVPVPEVLLPLQVVRALLRFCRPSPPARGCWGRSCPRTSSWMPSACGWSRATCALPAQCKVLTPSGRPAPSSAFMPWVVGVLTGRQSWPRSGKRQGVVESPLLQRRRNGQACDSLTLVVNVPPELVPSMPPVGPEFQGL